MPELPEVETVRRGLEKRLLGQRVARAETRRKTLRIPLPERFAERMKGRRFEHLDRLGKYILAYLDDGAVLIIHLGMSGRFTLDENGKAPDGRHDHVVFIMEDGTVATFNDPRRFGLITMCREEEVESHRLLAKMGPDPLGNEFNGPFLADRLAGKRSPIKAALLDQKNVAGLGNIYVCEALYHSGISPKRSAHTVQGVRAERLAAAIRQVLDKALKAGGSTLRDYVQASGELGYFQHQFSVYGREGEACPKCDCGKSVKRIVQSGRSTFYCAERQR
ncbi:MAG: bifunctional DNA-formamidopyrimidine glycosylase/DNA-(apurinic or apyrimidinic site) lyase [Rhodospirillaceae bacterium]|nr:bifunctional DNA-formamidopyrimidine glycosylase/DNA-(apurinic or apyrimidinic site) lyase [Rhodospirillaceae bacterium]MBT3928268.1 bifunctional DNA-formamidopyrimidine glycosylase/DNA-(apurinic or apyrimidinic site) lyase [Rhodospirillaceae bacterium]MBT5039591.1 bifunctional DNA-formamidopyrimidine glycosylase/DNA-(apurinic or apyrimidinic site) lyase [Rhodospirillaceae bacterium]MBT5676275.1 bifunctional DNA-formamidopyrimidine glycosylase/DNA-(apurinic or apyrimidinic site) lyase [Rhodos